MLKSHSISKNSFDVPVKFETRVPSTTVSFKRIVSVSPFTELKFLCGPTRTFSNEGSRFLKKKHGICNVLYRARMPDIRCIKKNSNGSGGGVATASSVCDMLRGSEHMGADSVGMAAASHARSDNTKVTWFEKRVAINLLRLVFLTMFFLSHYILLWTGYRRAH